MGLQMRHFSDKSSSPREVLPLISILALILILHLILIDKPITPVFDEGPYVSHARALLNGVASNLEHPFLGKAFISLGILSLGDNPYGWRAPMILFGMGTLYVFYLLAKDFLPERLALSALALLAFDNLLFVHSSIAMLEVPSMFFGLLALHLYFTKQYWLSAASFGLSFLSKEQGILFLLALALYHAIVHYKLLVKGATALVKFEFSAAIKKATAFLAISFMTVALPMQFYVMAYKPLGMTNFVSHLLYMLGLTYKAEFPWPPWSWITSYPGLTYYVSASYETPRTIWSGVGSMPLWWGFWFVLPSSLYLYLKGRDEKALFLLLLIGGTYLPMFPVYFQRFTLPFYFLNTLPALAIGIPYGINGLIHRGWQRALMLAALLLLQGLYFAHLFPLDII